LLDVWHNKTPALITKHRSPKQGAKMRQKAQHIHPAEIMLSRMMKNGIQQTVDASSLLPNSQGW
jgi:hypothetical protein